MCFWCGLVCFSVLVCFDVYVGCVMLCCGLLCCDCAVVGLSLGLDWGGDGCGVPLFWCVGGALLFWCVSGILGFGIWGFVLSCVVLVWFWFPMF